MFPSSPPDGSTCIFPYIKPLVDFMSIISPSANASRLLSNSHNAQSKDTGKSSCPLSSSEETLETSDETSSSVYHIQWL